MRKHRKIKGVKRYKGRNYHHFKPVSRGGDDSKENLLLLKIDRHECWHKLFKNQTLNEVIQILLRIKRIREVKNEIQRFDRLHSER